MIVLAVGGEVSSQQIDEIQPQQGQQPLQIAQQTNNFKE
jgi:hypothetical protein